MSCCSRSRGPRGRQWPARAEFQEAASFAAKFALAVLFLDGLAIFPLRFSASTVQFLLLLWPKLRVSADISIIIPVYNEQENILPLTREVIGAMKGSPGTYEIVFVDDCSTDGTWDRIQQAHQEDSRVRGLRHARNCGQSAAL